MQRFYMFHTFFKYPRNVSLSWSLIVLNIDETHPQQNIAACALFLAAKVEEQPRKLEHVIKVNHMCVQRENTHIDVKSAVS